MSEDAFFDQIGRQFALEDFGENQASVHDWGKSAEIQEIFVLAKAATIRSAIELGGFSVKH